MCTLITLILNVWSLIILYVLCIHNTYVIVSNRCVNDMGIVKGEKR